ARDPAFEVLPPGMTAGGEADPEAAAGPPETEPVDPAAAGDAPAEGRDAPDEELAVETPTGPGPAGTPAGQDPTPAGPASVGGAPPAAVLPLGVTGSSRAAV